MSSNAVGIWHRWREVTDYTDPDQYGRLFRASSPYYEGKDSDQKFDRAALQVLIDHEIKRIVSFNSISYSDYAKSLLGEAGISYLHLPVRDFTAPTLNQLESLITFMTQSQARNTLIHCGFGQGRTGVGVTAAQLFVTGGTNPPESVWGRSVNGVEEASQIAILREFRDTLGKTS